MRTVFIMFVKFCKNYAKQEEFSNNGSISMGTTAFFISPVECKLPFPYKY